jgi:hypothetical protein
VGSVLTPAAGGGWGYGAVETRGKTFGIAGHKLVGKRAEQALASHEASFQAPSQGDAVAPESPPAAPVSRFGGLPTGSGAGGAVAITLALCPACQPARKTS